MREDVDPDAERGEGRCGLDQPARDAGFVQLQREGESAYAGADDQDVVEFRHQLASVCELADVIVLLPYRLLKVRAAAVCRCRPCGSSRAGENRPRGEFLCAESVS